MMWHRTFDMNACSVDNTMTLAPWQSSVDTADDQHTAFCWLYTHHYSAKLCEVQNFRCAFSIQNLWKQF